MTEQEALEIITNIVQRQNVTKEIDLALEIVQKATEKQIPKKPDKRKNTNKTIITVLFAGIIWVMKWN